MLVLDDCNFHESVNVDAFESQRTISFQPPEGEFTVMNYRTSGEFTMPFRVFPFLEDVGRTRLDLLVRLRADLPQTHYATALVVRIPIPKAATRYDERARASTSRPERRERRHGALIGGKFGSRTPVITAAYHTRLPRARVASSLSTSPPKPRPSGGSRACKAAPRRHCASR